jgi:hypothetical protein
MGAIPLTANQARAEEEVRVTVVTILASDRDKEVDKRLTCIAREVQKEEPALTSFRYVSKKCKSVTVGNKETYDLVEEQTACVVVKQAADKEDRVCLKIKAPQLGEITYTAACGKYFPIITRYQTKNGERLILAVMVQPCQDK